MKIRASVLIALAVVGLFASLTLYGGVSDFAEQVASFPPLYLLAVLALSLANFLLRYIRWEFYLRLLGINVGRGQSCTIFASGLAMVVTPGKVGELAKAYFLRDAAGTPVATSAPVVVIERATDIVAVALLSLLSLAVLPYAPVLLPLALVLVGMFALLLVSHRGLNLVLKLPFLRSHASELASSLESFKTLTDLKVFAVAAGISLLAWLSEGVGLWIVLHGIGSPIGVLEAISIFSTATLIGGLSMLPGGLLATEGSMLALLRAVSVSRTAGSAATVLIRLFTLWLAVAIGAVALLLLTRIKIKRA